MEDAVAKPAAVTWSRPAQEQLALYTVPGAARFLGCSEMHVYRLIGSGQLRAVDIASDGARRSKTRVRFDDLAAYIQKRTRTAG